MITYDLSKADNETKTKFIADAQAIHQTTVDGNNVTVLYQKGSAYCNNKDYKRAGDTIYVNLRSNGMANSGGHYGYVLLYRCEIRLCGRYGYILCTS